MKEVIESYNYYGTLQSGPLFMVELGIDFYDIACYKNKYWFACNSSEYPIRIYDQSGNLVESLSSSIIPAAHGMTFDEEGYLWVSNMNTDEIYKIDVSMTSLACTTWGSIKSGF